MKHMYIHIPFCKKICSYCDFCKMFYNHEFIDKYLDELNNEITNYYNGEEMETVYIGGGTPSSLSYDELNKLFKIVSVVKVSNNYEYSFECNPDDISEDLLDDIVEKPYNYDFPPTLDDYMEEYMKNYNILWSIEANNEISPCKLDNRQEKLSTEYKNRLFDKNICSFIVEAPLNKWIPIPTRFYKEPVYRKSFTFYIKVINK